MAAKGLCRPRTEATQCNFYIQETKDKQVQTVTDKRRSKELFRTVASQTSKPFLTVCDVQIATQPKPRPSDVGTCYKQRANVSTQCNRDLKIPTLKSNSAIQATVPTQERSSQTGESSLQRGTFLKQVEAMISASGFSICIAYCKNTRGEDCLVLTHPSNLGLPGEDVDPVKVVITSSGKCTVAIPFKPVEIYNLLLQDIVLEENVLTMLEKVCGEGYAFCPGIYNNECQRNLATIKQFDHPFIRTQSAKCEVWYENRSSLTPVVQCKNCRLSAAILFKNRKRTLNLTPTKTIKRASVTSRCTFANLTPRSHKFRMNSLRKARRMLQVKVKKLEKRVALRDVFLNDKQSKEMEDILGILNTDHQQEIDSALEGLNQSKVLKEIWKRDSDIIHEKDVKMFDEDQELCKTGWKGNRWSTITLRIAFAVYCRSPSAYKALQAFDILKLPSVETLKKKAQKFNNAPGEDHKYLLEQEAKYKSFQEENRTRGLPIPKGEGVIIYDEVKVIEKVIWNSRNHEFKGFAMSETEFPLLNDLLNITPEAPSPTQYVLQFLWRDLTSNFDVIGPYYTMGSSMSSDILLGCILSTIRFLSAYSFNTMAIVCDGASENLSTVKLTMGIKGAFKMDTKEEDFSINPSFSNPYRTDREIYFIICPTHQMKNMISALHSSRPNGPKAFNRNDSYFGWNEIKDVKVRDEHRHSSGKIRFVPRFLPSYVKRDSWTRLNVKPSKIMQQENVLSELFAFGEGSEGTETERKSAMECYKYLRSCNMIFENGLLSSKKIYSASDPCMKSIMNGYNYFTEWLKEITTSDPNVNLKASTQSMFLSWQTWDLLRISVFGFHMLVNDFLTRYPQHYITPVRINGSALESLFSQMKFSAGSKLSGVNYSTAKKSVVLKSNIHGGNSCNKGYRDVPLYIRESDI